MKLKANATKVHYRYMTEKDTVSRGEFVTTEPRYTAKKARKFLKTVRSIPNAEVTTMEPVVKVYDVPEDVLAKYEIVEPETTADPE